VIFPVQLTGSKFYVEAATHYVAHNWALARFGAELLRVGEAVESSPIPVSITVATPLTAIELAAEYVESERQRARREAYERALYAVKGNTKAAAIRWLEREVGK
jgi:hypothetical protein